MWIEETKNGKFKFVERYTDYLTGQTKRVSVTMDKNTAQTRKTAQKALDEKIDCALSKTVKKEISLKDLVDEYRKDQERTVKKSTYTRNFHACNSFLKILGEDTIISKMNAKYVRDRFLATGRDPGTLNEYLTRFKAMIRWGYRNDMVADISFLDKLEPFKDVPHKVKIQDKYLESEEVKFLINGMEDEVWRTVTEFLVMSGLRFGEFAALEKSDIDYANNVIHVTKNYDPNNNIVTTTKTLCSVRDVYMQDELKAVCKKLYGQMLRRRLMYSLPQSELFFFSPNGDHVHYYAYNKYLKENSMRLIGRTITVHALRHTHASLLLEKGVPIETISRRLGHENSKVTREIYLHVTKKLKEKDNEKIAAVSIL
ncbi:MAG: site-specific integrase [Fusicatenibacter sp.]|nr:site-specific integrase [Fusicatenibacter sp.]